MSTSNDGPSDRRAPVAEAPAYRPVRVLAGYIAVGLFLLVFGQIYDRLSHGVNCVYMTLAFLIPLVMGGLPFLFFIIAGKSVYPGKAARSLYRWACTCFSGASVLAGVIIIYGTDSLIPVWYAAAGGLLLLAAGVVYIASIRRRFS